MIFRYIIQTIEKEYQRWLLWMPVFLALGIGHYLYFQNILMYVYILFIAFFYMLFLKKKHSVTSFFLWGGLLYFLGIIVMHIRIIMLSTELIQNVKNDTVLTGVIEKIENHPRREKIQRIIIKNMQLTIANTLSKSLKTGDVLTVNCDLLPYSYPTFIDGFNWRRYYFFKSLKGTGKIKSILSHHPKNQTFIQKTRDFIKSDIEKNLSKKTAGVAKALSIGDTSGMRIHNRRAYQ